MYRQKLRKDDFYLVDRKRIGVIGAGMAGLIATVTLAKQGHQVSLFARAKDIILFWERLHEVAEVVYQISKTLISLPYPKPNEWGQLLKVIRQSPLAFLPIPQCPVDRCGADGHLGSRMVAKRHRARYFSRWGLFSVRWIYHHQSSVEAKGF